MLSRTNFIEELISHHKQKSKEVNVYLGWERRYDIKIYKLQQFSQAQIRATYQGLQDKYNSKQLEVMPTAWHEHERRLSVWVILSYKSFVTHTESRMDQKHWNILSESYFNKSPEFLRFQYRNLIKSKERIVWTPEESRLLEAVTLDFKPGEWNLIAKEIYFRSNQRIFKSAKQCREHFLNHLDHTIVKGEWTPDQDALLLSLVQTHGKKWSKVSQMMNGKRTEHMIKNRFNAIQSKKKQPQQHYEPIEHQHASFAPPEQPHGSKFPSTKLKITQSIISVPSFSAPSPALHTSLFASNMLNNLPVEYDYTNCDFSNGQYDQSTSSTSRLMLESNSPRINSSLFNFQLTPTPITHYRSPTPGDAFPQAFNKGKEMWDKIYYNNNPPQPTTCIGSNISQATLGSSPTEILSSIAEVHLGGQQVKFYELNRQHKQGGSFE